MPVRTGGGVLLLGGLLCGAALAQEQTAPTVESGEDIVLGSSEMDLLYAEVAESRRLLDRHARDLRGRLRGLKLPGADARTVRKSMQQVQYLLKTPQLRAAFSELGEIHRELRRVNIARRRLKRVDEILRKWRAERQAPESVYSDK